MNTQITYLETLKDEFLERRKRNPNYSLRAYSRDLGMSPSHLCMILGGKKKLTTERAARLGLKLNLPPEKFISFVTSTLDPELPGLAAEA